MLTSTRVETQRRLCFTHSAGFLCGISLSETLMSSFWWIGGGEEIEREECVHGEGGARE